MVRVGMAQVYRITTDKLACGMVYGDLLARALMEYTVRSLLRTVTIERS
jgi:hypothetical protein